MSVKQYSSLARDLGRDGTLAAMDGTGSLVAPVCANCIKISSPWYVLKSAIKTLWADTSVYFALVVLVKIDRFRIMIKSNTCEHMACIWALSRGCVLANTGLQLDFMATAYQRPAYEYGHCSRPEYTFVLHSVHIEDQQEGALVVFSARTVPVPSVKGLHAHVPSALIRSAQQAPQSKRYRASAKQPSESMTTLTMHNPRHGHHGHPEAQTTHTPYSP